MTTRFIHNDRHTGASFPQTEPSDPPEPAPAIHWRTVPRLVWLRDRFSAENNRGEGLPLADLAREMAAGTGEAINENDAAAAVRACGGKVDAVQGRFVARLARKVSP